jgi:hypothetical protein
MMRGVLTVNDCPICKLSLHCLSQNWVERFVLVTTHIHATNHEGNTQFEPFQVIRSFARLLQKSGSETKQITNALHGGPCLEYFDRQ